MAEETQRHLSWFIENEVEPTDEQLAESAINDGMITVSEGDPGADQPATDTGAAAPAESETAATETAPTTKPAGMSDEDWAEIKTLVVKTKDGQGDIPYDVLAGSRQQVAALKQQNEGMAQELEQLRATAAAAAPNSPAGTIPNPAGEIPNEVLMTAFEQSQGRSYDELEEEFGEDQAKLFLNQIRDNLLLRQDLANIRESIDSAGDEGSADEVQDAIDAIPDLVKWQQLDGDMWKEALREDAHLRESPLWAGKSYQERFTEVTRRLGGSVEPAPTTTADNKTAAEKAAEVLAKTATTVAQVPTSLSSVPGGAHEAETAADKAEGMSNEELLDLAMTNPDRYAELLEAIP